ncbi:T9SS type A sorting domain-containing protein [Jejuia spongiicola]|uniref:T9SS type A sorting domain-containing protein n=1 Tax=Jejuia spongiicola TaxID=2942207 RepID=A0ABT0QC09_9FLAO|nr:T9SS type A sorting domain-containing protein [Jejuia spongiicola]MCL6294524.1 T9SS type A sorting domain-containing protein [Jejuia spongiicola]
MKQLYFFTIILLSLKFYAQNCNIGNDEFITPIPGNFIANNLLGTKYTLSEEGTLKSINMIGFGTGSGVQMAVYDDNAGVPNNLITFSDFGTVGNGVISLPVTPIVLSPGDYWVMAIYEITSEATDYANIMGSTVYYKALDYGGALPTNASGFDSFPNRDFLYFLEIECGNTLSNNNHDFREEVSIFPNPSSDYITISNLEFSKNYTIINYLGQEVMDGTISNNEKIDIRSFNNGLYFLKFNNEYTVKFIKIE